MVLFGYEIVFGGEDVSDPSLPQIPLHEVAHLEGVPLRTPWLMEGRYPIRYYSQTPFVADCPPCRWALEVRGVVTLIWDASRASISYLRGEGFEPSLLEYWVCHTFFPLVLALEERYHILHVGAVAVAGQAVLFLAPSFGGKSTLVGEFLRRGHALLSDDTLAVSPRSGGFDAVASYPFHRPHRKPQTLGERVANSVTTPLPITALYALELTPPNRPVTLTPLEGIEKFTVLAQSHFVAFESMRMRQFEMVGKMAQTLPLYRLGIPKDTRRLAEVYTTVRESLAGLE